MTAHGLEKAVWTDADFEHMGWHDATVWSFAARQQTRPDLNPEPPWYNQELVLDLDYITKWVLPVRPAKHYTFWVATATLVFHGVTGLRIVNDSDGETMEIADIERVEKSWHVEGQNFDMRFQASGFRQIFRALPLLQQQQSLTLAERGGYSFAETPAEL